MGVVDWFASAETEVKLWAISGAVLVLVGAVIVGLLTSALWRQRQVRAEERALQAKRAAAALTVVIKRPPFGPGAVRRIPRWNNVTDATVLLGAAKGGTR